jgi:hypothetical protein
MLNHLVVRPVNAAAVLIAVVVRIPIAVAKNQAPAGPASLKEEAMAAISLKSF